MSTYQSLYRKYRPSTFSGIVGQRHVTQTLAHAIAGGRISHAYLFCGPRGTGKTTTARVLAMALNCEKGPTPEPCGECGVCAEIKRGACLDVVEFDAASHRGVDDIEELRRRFQFAPGQTRTKVYIIDEVHQLSDQAFDMLLKVLEEPPGQVVFVLATTEPHKIKPTILSRCQRFDFHRIGARDMLPRLREVCEKEGLKAEEAALSLLAQAADGAARDGLSLLEQAAAFSTDTITVAEVRNILGGIEPELLLEFADILATRRVEAAFALISRVVSDGKDLLQLLRELLKHLRDLLVIKIAERTRQDPAGMELAMPREYLPRLQEQARAFSQEHLLQVIDLLCAAEGELRYSGQPRLFLELFAARACATSAVSVSAETAEVAPRAESRGGLAPQKSTSPQPTTVKAEAAQPAAPAPAAAPGDELGLIKQKWPEVLEILKKEKQVGLTALIRGVEPAELRGTVLTLAFAHEFHKTSVDKPESKAHLQKALEKATGRALQIECKLKGEISAAAKPAPSKDDPLLNQALTIFPGSEVV